jgi:hypothetical protein
VRIPHPVRALEREELPHVDVRVQQRVDEDVHFDPRNRVEHPDAEVAGHRGLEATSAKPPEKQAEGLSWAAPVRNISGGLSALLMIGFVVSIVRGRTQNATPTAEDEAMARQHPRRGDVTDDADVVR